MVPKRNIFLFPTKIFPCQTSSDHDIGVSSKIQYKNNTIVNTINWKGATTKNTNNCANRTYFVVAQSYMTSNINKMSTTRIIISILLLNYFDTTFSTTESDITYKVDPGSRTCFYEKARSGQMLEVQYQVTDGNHGDLDISFDVIGPNGEQIVNDYKKQQNSIITDISEDGDYVFCLDNTHSVLNTKTVFIYILIDDEIEAEAPVSTIEDGTEYEEILEWMGVDADEEPYYIEVNVIAKTITKVLKHVVKARHLLDLYGASKSKDNHLVNEDTFIVDMWSGFQISFMILIGTIQVVMIKKLFGGI